MSNRKDGEGKGKLKFIYLGLAQHVREILFVMTIPLHKMFLIIKTCPVRASVPFHYEEQAPCELLRLPGDCFPCPFKDRESWSPSRARRDGLSQFILCLQHIQRHFFP